VAPASVAVRAMEAVRAAWVAAESTAWVAMATRPAKMMSPTNSRNAGSPIAASSAAEPRSMATAFLDPFPPRGEPGPEDWVIRSTVTVADWVIVGRHPGRTLSATPRTVTDAVVAVRVPVTVGR
jgi:hypothetical protein